MKLKIALLSVLLLIGGNAAADDDHEAARRLRESGQIVPLESIFERVRSQYPEGTLLEVELEREKGVWVYEVELLDAAGRVREMLFDARTGEFIGQEGKAQGSGH